MNMHTDAIRRMILASLLALQGCASGPSAASLYERLGGLPGITAVVDKSVDRHAADPRTRRSFEGVNLKTLKASIVLQACEATGGPCRYEGESMARAHAGLAITAEEFDTAIGHIDDTLDEFKVSARDKEAFLQILRPLRADIVGR
jgi:hemoglobin